MAKTDISVEELASRVKRGEIKLPEMQRRYVWTATRVRDLLDSLYRGYPSGSILVWETDADVETRDLAVSPTLTPSTSTQQLLLDGQQRITSLTAVLSGQPVTVRNKKRPVDIMFNLDHPEGPPVEVIEINSGDHSASLIDIEGEEEINDIQAELNKRTFVVAFSKLKNNPIWVPVSEIFARSESEILKKVGINSDDERWDKYSIRLQNVKKIASYQYVMHVLERDLSYEEVTEIFVRVNSLGVKLRGSDLALAQITSKWKGFMNELEEYAEHFKENKDYLLETGILVRTMVAIATGQSKFKTVGRINLEDLKSAWDKTKSGFVQTINFLKANADIERLGILSSPMLLVTVTYYLIKENESLTDLQEKHLLKWIYYAHMRGHYSMGSSESILDKDLVTLDRGGDLDDLLQVLYDHVKKFEVDVRDITGKGVGSPLFSMLYIVLRANGAKDWKTGLALSESHLGSAHKIQYHHIFPKSLLQSHGYDKREINEIANMAFIGGKTNRQILNKLPREYLVNEIIAKRGEDALDTQLVTTNPAIWELDVYPEFLADRRRRIVEAINSYMANFD